MRLENFGQTLGVDPTIILYGEPWAAGDTLVCSWYDKSNWDRTRPKMDSGVGAFNDLYRNALKGTPDGAEPLFKVYGFYW